MSIPIKYIKGAKGNIFYPYTTIDAILDKDVASGGTSIKDTMLNVIKCSDVQNNNVIQNKQFSFDYLKTFFSNNENYKPSPSEASSFALDNEINPTVLSCNLIKSGNFGWGIAPMYSSQKSKKAIFKITFKLTSNSSHFRIVLGDINRLLKREEEKYAWNFANDKTDFISSFFIDENKKISITNPGNPSSETINNTDLLNDWLTLTYIVNKSKKTFNYSLKDESTNTWIYSMTESIPFPESSEDEENFVLTDDTSWGIYLHSWVNINLSIKEMSLTEHFTQEDKFTLFLKETADKDNYEPIFYQNGEYYYMTNMNFKEGITQIGSWIDGTPIWRITFNKLLTELDKQDLTTSSGGLFWYSFIEEYCYGASTGTTPIRLIDARAFLATGGEIGVTTVDLLVLSLAGTDFILDSRFQNNLTNIDNIYGYIDIAAPIEVLKEVYR